MSLPIVANSPIAGPISQDWTIEGLLDWFGADDARLSDPTVRPALRAIEEALTGSRWTIELDATLEGSRMTREPAIVSLVRSIAVQVSRHPALRAHTVGEILDGRVPVAETVVPVVDTRLPVAKTVGPARVQRQILRPER